MQHIMYNRTSPRSELVLILLLLGIHDVLEVRIRVFILVFTVCNIKGEN